MFMLLTGAMLFGFLAWAEPASVQAPREDQILVVQVAAPQAQGGQAAPAPQPIPKRIPVPMPAALGGLDNQHLHVKLLRLLPGQKDLEIRLATDADSVTAAFAYAPTYNRMVHEVTIGESKRTRNGAEVKLTVEIRSDGYVPKPGEPTEYELKINLLRRNNGLAGVYKHKGKSTTIRGQVLQKTPAAPVRIDMRWENALLLPGSKKGAGRRIRAGMTLAGGKTLGTQLYPRGSVVDTAYQARATHGDVTLKNGKLTGRIDAEIKDHKGKITRLRWELDGTVIGDRAAGTIATRVNGEAKEQTGVFLADLTPVRQPRPAKMAQRVELLDCLGPGKNLVLYLRPGADGLHGYAATPNYNNSIHTIQAEKLRLRDGRLAGPVIVHIQPDPWVPRDGKGYDVKIDLQADVRQVEIDGHYSAIVQGRQVEQDLAGDLETIEPLPAAGHVTLKVENALVGKSKYHNRAFLSFAFKDGRITGGRVWNNHSALSGKVTGGTLQIDAKTGRMVAEVSATIDKGGKVTPGAYEFRATGVFIDDLAGGTYTSRHLSTDKSKTGTCWASIKSD